METYLDCPQGSNEWLIERSKRVTATNIAAIMGISPWKTAMDLFNDKMGMGKPFITNPAIEHGKAMEDPIREYYEAKVGEWFPPAVVVGPEGWELASLDGINSAKTRTLEIKTCGKKVFEEALKGNVPSYYISQVQFGMMCVPTAIDCELVFYNCGIYAHVILERDEEYITELYEAGKEFYETSIVAKLPPPLSEKDSIDMSNDLAWMTLAQQALVIYPKMKELEKKWKSLRAEIQDLTDDGSCHGGGIKLTKKWRPGGLDTAKMEQDDIDIEKYRKSPSSSLMLTVNQKKGE